MGCEPHLRAAALSPHEPAMLYRKPCLRVAAANITFYMRQRGIGDRMRMRDEGAFANPLDIGIYMALLCLIPSHAPVKPAER
jgi:hypothetical protein